MSLCLVGINFAEHQKLFIKLLGGETKNDRIMFTIAGFMEYSSVVNRCLAGSRREGEC